MSIIPSVDLSVIIPAYNEEQRVGPTLASIAAFLRYSGLRREILVVDDGSTDGTVALVHSLTAGIRGLRVLATAPNRGKGHAVRAGMLAARGRVRVMMDADGAIGPEQLPALIEPVLRGEADIAIGSRRAPGARVDREPPWYRRWWSRLSNRVVQWAVIPGIADTQCGFKAFSAAAARAVFSRARIDGWAFDLEALALARRMGLSIRELPVVWSDDPRSRISPIRDAWNVFREMLVIRGNLRRGVYGPLGGPLGQARLAAPRRRPRITAA